MPESEGTPVEAINPADEKHVISKVRIGEDIVKLENGKEQKIVFESLKVKSGDFDFVITARKEGGNEILGYVGMRDKSLHLGRVEPDFMEEEMLKVNPAYFRKGLGSNLVLFSQLASKLNGKKTSYSP